MFHVPNRRMCIICWLVTSVKYWGHIRPILIYVEFPRLKLRCYYTSICYVYSTFLRIHCLNLKRKLPLITRILNCKITSKIHDSKLHINLSHFLFIFNIHNKLNHKFKNKKNFKRFKIFIIQLINTSNPHETTPYSLQTPLALTKYSLSSHEWYPISRNTPTLVKYL